MKNALLLATVALLAACTTPKTTLKDPKTGQVSTCGGTNAASWLGGAVGYHIQKDRDETCVKRYEGQGYKITEVNE